MPATSSAVLDEHHVQRVLRAMTLPTPAVGERGTRDRRALSYDFRRQFSGSDTSLATVHDHRCWWYGEPSPLEVSAHMLLLKRLVVTKVLHAETARTTSRLY